MVPGAVTATSREPPGRAITSREAPNAPKQQAARRLHPALHGDIIAIIDHDGGKNATNDAENIIADLAADFNLSKYRVIDRDTRGIWDQVLVDCPGRFAGLSSINEHDLHSRH